MSESLRGKRSTARLILSLLDVRDRWILAGLLGATVVTGIMQVVGVGSILPFVSLLSDPDLVQHNRWLARVYEGLGFQDTGAFLFLLGMVALVALLLSNGASALTQWGLVRFVWSKKHRLSTQLLERYLRQPYQSFLDRNSADTGTSVLNEVGHFTNGVLSPFLQMVAAGASLLCLTAFLVWLEPVMAVLVATALGGGYALLYGSVRRKLRRLGRTRLQANTRRFKAVSEAFGGIKTVKAQCKEGSLLERYRESSLEFADVQATHAVITQLPRYAVETLAFGSVLVLVLYMMASAGDVRQIIPLVSVYALATYRMIPALQRIYQAVTQLRFNSSVVESLHDDMNIEGEEEEGDSGGPPSSGARGPGLTREVALRDVTFSYPGSTPAALENVTITVPRDHAVALVGETGSGKTTAADLMLGLLRPVRGGLYVDGQKLDLRQLRAWRRKVGYVPQHIYLTDDTVARNIAFGVPDEEISRASVERAARIANIHEFIVRELSLGYETVVGERGIRLSAGQGQRIGIARALYHDPDVLVLDEATSALDGTTEAAVMEAIERVAGRKTLLIIAHRLATVRACDAIYVLGQGRVLDRGTYGELLERCPEFREMARLPSFDPAVGA